jgi:hypothetical protein
MCDKVSRKARVEGTDEVTTTRTVSVWRGEWWLVRLFECIGAVRGAWRQMKKASPRDYDAETGCLEQSAQKSTPFPARVRPRAIGA